MVGPDIEFVKKCLDFGLVQSPCLELGVGYEGPNNRALMQAAKVEYFGTDTTSGKGVDYVVDFEDSSEAIDQLLGGKRFGTVFVLNVLEHTFDPIRVLDNVFHILQANGTCIVIAPAIWPLHDFPRDCWRINPNFYEEYCKRRSLNLLAEHFEYIGFGNVQALTDSSGAYVLPHPAGGSFKRLKSKLVHKVFDTSGRGMLFPSFVGIGVVIQKPAPSFQSPAVT